MGVTTAPVAGSGSEPAWMARVEKPRSVQEKGVTPANASGVTTDAAPIGGAAADRQACRHAPDIDAPNTDCLITGDFMITVGVGWG